MLKNNNNVDDIMVVVDQQQPVNRALMFFLILVIVMLLGIAWLANMLREAEEAAARAHGGKAATNAFVSQIPPASSGKMEMKVEARSEDVASTSKQAEGGSVPEHKARLAEEIEAASTMEGPVATQARQSGQENGETGERPAAVASAPAEARKKQEVTETASAPEAGQASAESAPARQAEVASTKPSAAEKTVQSAQTSGKEQEQVWVTVFYEGRLVKVTPEQFEKIKRGEKVELPLHQEGAQPRPESAAQVERTQSAVSEQEGSVLISQSSEKKSRSLSEILARINRLLEEGHRRMSMQ